MKKIFITLCTFSALFFIPIVSDAAPQCDGNRAPDLQDGDPACYTKSTTTGTTTTYEKVGTKFYSTCTWVKDCDNCTYLCGNPKKKCGPSDFYTAKGNCGGKTRWCSNMGSPPKYGYYKDIYDYVTRTKTDTSYKCYYRVVDEWSTCDITTGMQSAISTSQRSRSGRDCQNYHEATTRPCAVCTPGEDIDITQMPTTTGICAFGNPRMPRLVDDTWEWQCLGNYNDIYDDAACSAPNNADGVCGSEATGAYAWSDTAFRGRLCTPGIPTENVNFPDYGQTVTWGCNGIGTGTSTTGDACSANRLCPEAVCDGLSDGVATDTRPSSGLCLSPSTLTGNVTLNADGRWEWNCDYQYNTCASNATCSAPSCLAGMPIDLQRFVYFDSDGTPNNATVRVTCPNVCCEIEGQDLDEDDEQNNFICEGDGSAEVEIAPGGSNFDARCWFRNGSDDDDDVDYDLSVETMCVARSCNSQGTCQATPQPARSANACTSTCSSDADCSTGRMIETRP